MLGSFITFEGIDASGKSTQSALLAKYIGNSLLTREIGGSKVGEDIREIIMNTHDLDSKTELLLIMAARAEHLSKLILPNLARGKNIVCDRFIDSTAAYQNFDFEYLYALHNSIFKILPDLTILIDIDPEIAFERIQNRNKKDRFDMQNIEYHKKIRQRYLMLSELFQDRICVIDGDKSVDEVHHDVKKVVDQWLS